MVGVVSLRSRCHGVAWHPVAAVAGFGECPGWDVEAFVMALEVQSDDVVLSCDVALVMC